MKTIILGMLFALSCNYCFAQLKIENSTPKPEKKDVYDVSQDLYIRESHRGRFNDSLDYKSYYKFINQRIFCISDEAFAPYGNRYALKRQLVNLPTPIKGCIQYKKKQLDFSINQIATYLYHPIIKSVDPQSSNVKVIDDMRGDNANWSCYEKDDKNRKPYTMVLYNAYAPDNVVVNEHVSLVGDSYLIKKILTLDEALKLLEEDPQIKLITKSESTHGLGKRETYYYESLVLGKTFLTPSVQNDILIKNDIEFGGSNDCESPIFLMESKSGELFLTRLNEDKFISGISMKDGSAFAYTTYILENHIEYLKEKFIGKLYSIQHYPNPNEKGLIEDIVLRDNALSVKYVNVETKETGYRSMEWDSTNKRWVVADAGEIMPKQTK